MPLLAAYSASSRVYEYFSYKLSSPERHEVGQRLQDVLEDAIHVQPTVAIACLDVRRRLCIVIHHTLWIQVQRNTMCGHTISNRI